MQELNGEFIKETRQALGMKQAEFAAEIGTSQGRLSKWERDEDKPSAQFTIRILQLAQRASTLRENLVPLGGGGAPTKPYRIVGEVQAGVWMEAVEHEYDDQKEVYITPPPGLENMDLSGFEVRGSSMNSIYPDGSIVFVEATISNGVRPRSGQHVMVNRRNKSGLYEATLKEFVIDNDGSHWLWPRSTDPNHQTPISYDDGHSEDATITGVVRFSILRAP